MPIGCDVQNGLYYTSKGSTLLFFWVKYMLVVGISGQRQVVGR